MIYVSVLSGWLRHPARVKKRRETIMFSFAPSIAAVRASTYTSNDRPCYRRRGTYRSSGALLRSTRELPGEVVGVEIER